MSEEKHTPIFLAIKTALAKRNEDAVRGVGKWRTGMFCGLEDRNITDKYDACEYGYEKALDRVDEWILDGLDDLIDQACNSHKALVDALEAWQLMDTESADKNPAPCNIMRGQYRKIARELTEAAMGKKRR